VDESVMEMGDNWSSSCYCALCG